MSLLSVLQTKCRLVIPDIADTSALSDANLLSLLNEAAMQFLGAAKAHPTSTQFASVASGSSYALRTYVPTYHAAGKGGLWWYNGSAWRPLQAETRASMNRKFPAWLRSSRTGSPQRYFIEGGTLYVDPAPVAVVANSFELFHYARSQDGTASQYVFTASESVELTDLLDYEDILVDWVRALVAAMLSNSVLSIEWRNSFYARREAAKGELAGREDLIPNLRPYGAGRAMQQARQALRSGR